MFSALAIAKVEGDWAEMSEEAWVGDQVRVTGRAQVTLGLLGYRKKFGFSSRYNGKSPKV